MLAQNEKEKNLKFKKSAGFHSLPRITKSRDMVAFAMAYGTADLFPRQAFSAAEAKS
jgi:hypothetical protein